jgi:hypothetical protein
MLVSVMRSFVMALTAATGGPCLSLTIPSGTVIAAETESLAAAEIREGLCEATSWPMPAVPCTMATE